MTTHQIKVAKITEEELKELITYLQNLENVLKENDCYEDDDDVNKEIADIARLFPVRAAFVAPLNLGVLLDNYQDEESDILQHPKWILELYEKIEALESESATLQKIDDVAWGGGTSQGRMEEIKEILANK